LSQPQFLPASVEEFIPLDSPVRGFKAMLAALDFTAVLDTYFPYGGVGYHPQVLAGICLQGALDGIHAGRVLEERCRYDLRYWYLTGGQVPDHTTISRFRNRMIAVGEQAFGQTVKLARNLGLGDSGTATIDGRKTAGALDQWVRLRKDATIEELGQVSDSEARTLWCTRSGYVNGYSCMVAVDARDDVVIGACASNESSDNKSLGPLLEAIEVQSGKLPMAMVMDAGFSGSDSTHQLAAKEVEAFISPQEDEFWDLDADGEVICPAGHRLVKTHHKNVKTGARQVYRIKQCPKCPLKELCGVNKTSKSLTVHQGTDPRDYVRAMVLARTPEGRERLAYRKGSIERLFAQLFYHQRFRHFTMRGLSGAKVQLLILCMAHNLRVLASRVSEMLGPEAVAELLRHILGRLSSLSMILAPQFFATERPRDPTRLFRGRPAPIRGES
jgi:transposase